MILKRNSCQCFFIFLFSALRTSLTAVDKLKAGPYDIAMIGLTHCSDEGTKGVQFDPKIQKLNRTAVAVTMPLYLKYGLGDHLTLDVNIAQLTTNGWKDGYLKKDVGPVCKALDFYVPEFKKNLFLSAGQKDCPIEPGNYTVKDFILVLKVNAIPVFFYNSYRLDAFIKRKNVLIGCLRFLGDVIPKRRNKG